MAKLTEVDFDPFAAPAATSAKPSKASLFDEALAAEGITGAKADVARSIFQQESGSGKNTKTSNAGAVGDMQIIPATFNRMADKGWTIDNPKHNIRAGLRYVSTLYDKAGGDPSLTASGYYGGEGAIDKARKGIAVSDPRNPNAPNTLQYGQQVASRINGGGGAGGSGDAKPAGVKLTEVDFDPFAAKPAAKAVEEKGFLDKVSEIPGNLIKDRRDAIYGGAKAAADVPQGIAQLGLNLYDKALQYGPDGIGPFKDAVASLKGKVHSSTNYYNKYLAQQESMYQDDTKGSFAAGTGRATGILAPFVLSAGGSAAPQVSGAIPKLAQIASRMGPSAVVGATAAAGAPVFSDSGNYFEDKGKQVATGAVLGAAAPIVGAVAGKAVDAAKGGYNYVKEGIGSLAKPFTSNGQKQIADNILSTLAQGGSTKVSAQPLVPGSQPTLAESVRNPGIAGLQENLRVNVKGAKNVFDDRLLKNQEARLAHFDDVAGDAGKLEFHVAQRDQAAKELYGAALDKANTEKITPAIQKEVQALLQRPSINEASKEAQKRALERGETPSAEGSVRSLHDVKIELDAKIAKAVKDGDGGLASALQNTQKKLLGVMEEMSPAYKEARTTYAEMSKPINQMEAMQKLGLFDQQGNITLAKIQNALRNIEQKRGASGFNNEKALTEEQLGALKALRDDLLRQSNLSAGKALKSDTFQNISEDGIVNALLPGKYGGMIADRVRTPFTQAAQLLYSKPNEAIKNRLMEIMLNPNLATNALNRGNAALTTQATPNALMNGFTPYNTVPGLTYGGNVLLGNGGAKQPQ